MKKMPLLGLIALAALLAAVPLAAQSVGTLKDITITQENGKTAVLIRVDGQFTYETSSLAMPRRLVVDLTPVDKIVAPPYLQVNSAGIVSVRTGQFKAQTARVVFDLAEQNPEQAIVATGEGIKLTFWLAGEAPAVKEPERTQPVREIPQEEVKKAIGEPAGDQSRLNFFFRAGAGLTVFLKPNLTTVNSSPLYGETETVTGTYSLKNGIVFDGGFGKYFSLGSSRMKAGIGFSYWKLPAEGSFVWSLPHPLEFNQPRTVTVTETSALKTQMMSFYAYALFSFIDTDSFSLFFGPLAGYTSGKYLTLSDWNVSEKSPFTSADVTISNLTYAEDTVGELLFGASLNMELSLGNSLALVLDTKILYLNPKVANLGKRVNLFHVQPTLGIQFSF
jgi:hypothetical protein